jgi:eukaryotic-like serine/threonine-protein kinase
MSAYLWRGSGRGQGWLRYPAAVAAGALALMLAAIWTPGPLATGIGAAVTTVYSLMADLLRPQRGHDGGELPRSRSGRIPRVRHVNRPELAGVHAAEPDPATDGSDPPPYIERDLEPEFRRALARAPFVLVVRWCPGRRPFPTPSGTSRTRPRNCFPRPSSRCLWQRPPARTWTAGGSVSAERGQCGWGIGRSPGTSSTRSSSGCGWGGTDARRTYSTRPRCGWR